MLGVCEAEHSFSQSCSVDKFGTDGLNPIWDLEGRQEYVVDTIFEVPDCY